jgi:hypothetical protein
MHTKERLELSWEKDFSIEFLKRIHRSSAEELFNFIRDFLYRQKDRICHEVINSFPGHGKTTILKVITRKIIEEKHDLGGLIVLREKEQMREVEQFLLGNRYGVIYVDSNNYQEVKNHLSNYQFVVISHERLKNLAIQIKEGVNNGSPLNSNFAEITRWKDKKRVIFIDEAPSFVDHAIFELDKGLTWLDDCFQAAHSEFSSEEIIMIRSLFQILFAKELLENKGPLTGALKYHIDSQKFNEILTRFFKIIDHYHDRIASPDSHSRYQWLKKLFYKEQTGYIDSGFYMNNYSDHKKIICSNRIDYRMLGCSILILDGTAIFTKALYNNEYVITSLTNCIKYERMHIHQRNINTSSRKRKSSFGISVQELIAKDIRRLRGEGHSPFPLMNKFEVSMYLNLKVISKSNYQKFFSTSSEKNTLPINLLNTTGKNYLANQCSLYLTSLPNRPAVYYKAIAISLYKDSKTPLNLSMYQKDKKNQLKWFADHKLETLYQECLLSEMIQIIHRCSIRNLLLPSQKKVHIYIATNFNHIIDNLLNLFDYPVPFDRCYVESISKFQQRIEPKVHAIAEKIKKERIDLPNKIGKIEDGSSLKNLFNKNWKDLERKEEIIAAFNRHGLTIIENENNKGKLEKSLDFLKDSNNKV